MAKVTGSKVSKKVTATKAEKPSTRVAKSATVKSASTKPKVARVGIAVKKSGTPRPKKAPPTKTEEIHGYARKAAQYAIEKKATAVHLLDLTKITSMTDFFVVASGDSDKQVKAIAENVIVMMRDTEGIAPWHSEGWESLQWIIIDFVDFVVHVFQAEARIFYNLERLWADAPMEEIKDLAAPAKKTRTVKKAATRTEGSKEPIVRVIRSGS